MWFYMSLLTMVLFSIPWFCHASNLTYNHRFYPSLVESTSVEQLSFRVCHCKWLRFHCYVVVLRIHWIWHLVISSLNIELSSSICQIFEAENVNQSLALSFLLLLRKPSASKKLKQLCASSGYNYKKIMVSW